MASKRALQLLPLRASSSILRSQCPIPRREVLSISPARRGASRTQETLGQRRWHSSTPEDQASITYTFADVAKLLEATDSNDRMLIDVREPDEYDADAIPTSINIPVTSQPDALLLPADEFEDRFGFQKPPVSKEVIFYCKAGVRSAAAAQIAKEAGYRKVGEYKGSWLDWTKNGGATMKNPGRPSTR